MGNMKEFHCKQAHWCKFGERANELGLSSGCTIRLFAPRSHFPKQLRLLVLDILY